MRIGIITFVDYINYGNRLQNYALQCLLEECGVEVETILNERYYDYHYMKGHYGARFLNMLKFVFWKIYDWTYCDEHAMGYVLKSDFLTKMRIQGNMEFSKKYIHESKYIIRKGVFHKREMEKYDYLFSGSDQVWNPMMGGASALFFLRFVPQCKRVAFSASIGLDSIPDEYQKQWKIYLSGMRYISVREETAKKIVEEISDKQAEVLLDPTMLIDMLYWKKLAEGKKTNLPSKYIAFYILGNLSEQDILSLNKIRDDLGAEVIFLNDKKYEDIYAYDAVDFLNCIKNAELVVTDSFHACVFSILFHKSFFVLHREGEYENIYSRISGLLKKFDLEEHQIDCVSDISKKMGMHMEYERIMEMLKIERKKAEQYIERIIQ